MSSEYRDVLYEIANTCMKSNTYTRRIQSIHNRAMKALGMTENQRQERHEKAEAHARKTKAKFYKEAEE